MPAQSFPARKVVKEAFQVLSTWGKLFQVSLLGPFPVLLLQAFPWDSFLSSWTLYVPPTFFSWGLPNLTNPPLASHDDCIPGFFFLGVWVAHLWLTECRELPHSLGVQAHPGAAALHSSHQAVLVVREDRIAGVFPVCWSVVSVERKQDLCGREKIASPSWLLHFLGRNQASVYSPCDLPRSEAHTSL